ncbi:MAG: type II secretion system F family protein [Tepidisphaeraceae bacterium]
MIHQIVFILCVFSAVAGVCYFVAARAMGSVEDEKLRDRLASRGMFSSGSTGAGAGAGGVTVAGRVVVPFLQRIGQAAAQPFMPTSRQKQSGVRQTLALAGIYSASAVRVVAGGKVICLGLGLVAGYAVGSATGYLLMSVSLGGLAGYILPNTWLRMKIKTNQRALTYALPDALDLMVVCVEAGLTIDAAMQRVGEELNLAHPALSRELGIAHMETRVGLARAESLKNLGQRTGNPALQSLAAMLAQADRFGTSVAQSLRVHAESLRITRQQAAEELAARASVKMSFPLVLFIFPATFIILAGPTVVELMKSSFMQ